MEAPTRTTSTGNAASAILIVLALGLAFRLILAHVLPGSGFQVDRDAFHYWANNLAKEGLFGFYQRDFFHDYTPGYMYFLALVGILDGFLRGVVDLLTGVPLLGWLVDVPPLSLVAAGDLIKLPSILADLVLGWLAWSMTRELGAGRRAALAAGAIAVFNPISWFDSVVWGQVDSIGVIFLLLGVRELWRDRSERAAIFTVIAAIIKPQLGILVPVVAAVTIRRALFPSGAHGADPAPGEPGAPDEGRTTTGWERTVRGPVRILTTGLAGLITAVLVSLPFGLSVLDLVQQVATAAGGYPYLTVNAYNPWALFELNGAGLAASGTWICDVVVAHTAGGAECTQALMFGPLPALAVGATLLLAAIAAISVAIARRPDRVTILVGVAVLALAFFVLPTRVHERYLYPFFALAAILAAVSFRWRIAYVFLGLATLANMYVVLTTIYSDNPGIADWFGIGEQLRSWVGVAVVAVTHLVGLMWAGLQLREPAIDRLRTEIGETTLADGLLGWRARWRGNMAHQMGRRRLPARQAAPAPLGTAGAAGTVPLNYELPEWRERPSFVEAGPLGWLRSRLNDRPVRADRTALIAREGGGRLDRLDLWIVVVLVLAALTMRVWRLAEPYRMHFDEVYHARTATEFLQFWRYGLEHDIYEWTHPHLAKYAIAGGIVAWGDDKVGATSELGVPVRAAAIEDRWVDPAELGRRSGDRLHVATGSAVRSYDLRTRQLVGEVKVDGAAALAVDPTDHLLYIGTDAGDVLTIALQDLDAGRDESGAGPISAPTTLLATVDSGVTRLHVTEDGSGLLAATTGGDVVMLDPVDGRELGRAAFDAVAGFADAGSHSALVATPADVADPAAAAATLAELTGRDAGELQARLEAGGDQVVLMSVETAGDTRTAIDEAITDGRLAGFSIESLTRVAVAHAGGVDLIAPGAGEVVQSISLPGGAQGIALVPVDDPRLFVTTAGTDGPAYVTITVGGETATDEALLNGTNPLPGAGSWVGFDEASDQVHVLGAPPAGRPSDQLATVYVIEPHAKAVYADAPLSFAPAALVLDVNEAFPSADREQLLALDADGTTAAIDAGAHAFSWRLPGVLAGVAMAALLYLLTRILFRRRAVAVLVACLTLLDGMLFVQSRIAMNDAYVGLFIVAAYTLFAALWTGAWRWRWAFWVAMPAIGVLLGLALASKWVAAYAIGALGILILARSALGRVALLAGMIAISTALGYLAISVPVDTPPEAGWQIALLGFEFVLQGNLIFMLIMVFLTLTTATVIVLHPIAWSHDELSFAIGAPAVAGGAIALLALASGSIDRVFTLGSVQATPLQLAFGLAFLSLLVSGAFWLAGRAGFGPLAPPPLSDDPVRLLEPPAPPAEGWLRPGWSFGLPVGWMIVSLIAIPLAVYVASYVPWALLDGNRIVPDWPSGHAGQTLLDLTGSMYRYHNELTDAHPASSPWWAWPFDLKPVWFYQESFAGGTSAAIYDAGNLAIWWMGIPAMAFCAWQAFKRRSLALALVMVGFACQWIPWARIDRAAFQYHYYTSLPFVVMALAYFVAELWHGASRRTWLMARLAAAAAIIGPAALWLLHRPLCGFVRVDAVYKDSPACPTLIPELALTWRALGLAIVVGLAVFFLVRQFLALDRPDPDAPPARSAVTLLPMVVGGLIAFVALLIVARLVPDTPALTGTGIPVEPIALIVALPLLALGAVVATARDARRFVVGLLAAFAAMFVIFYPNISALPLPAAWFNIYQGLLPTYIYHFQFPVSIVDRNVAPPSLFAAGPALLFVALTVTSVILAYSAWIWRIALAERRLEEGVDESDSGTAYAGTGS